MTVQELIAHNNTEYTNAFFAAARKVPADKIGWVPMETGRSVLSLAQEVATSPTWPMALAFSDVPFEMTPEVMEEHERITKTLVDLDACEALATKNLEALNAAILSLPDAKLDTTVQANFGAPVEWPMAKALQIHAWNIVYHTGQVNYIQTLYGDTSVDF